MKGIVFNIQKFCVNDGPGIRTTVFLKGCTLRCRWCHNPESYEKSPCLGYYEEKCIRCGKCIEVCQKGCHTFDRYGNHLIDRNHCIVCGKCVEQCVVQALKITGQKMTAEEVVETVMQDKIFYDMSDGGITISGGEPFAQPEFTAEVLKLAKEKELSTCVETAGYVNFEVIEKSLPYIDLLLWDIKETDEERHRKYTGGELTKILDNLEKICEKNIPVILRCPIIPGVNDRAEHMGMVEKLKATYKNIQGIEKMPYHNLGIHKSIVHGLKKQEDFTKTKMLGGNDNV